MEISDSFLACNRDWDPMYLSTIFDMDFYDFNELWGNSVNDSELVDAVRNVETYRPIVEDISMDDSELCVAVESIEEGYVMHVLCEILIFITL